MELLVINYVKAKSINALYYYYLLIIAKLS